MYTEHIKVRESIYTSEQTLGVGERVGTRKVSHLDSVFLL